MRSLLFALGVGCILTGSLSPQRSSAAALHQVAKTNRQPVVIRLLPNKEVVSTGQVAVLIHQTPRHATFAAPRIADKFGAAIAGAGDVNHDGFRDLLVSASRYDFERKDRAGAAVVLSGSSTGLQAIAGWQVMWDRSRTEFGHALAGGGDVNGDGIPDIAVSALLRRAPGANDGLLTVFYGSDQSMRAKPDWQCQPAEAGTVFGRSMAMLDVNHDGFYDLIVGAPRCSETYDEEGGAFLFLGGKGGLIGKPAWSAYGGAARTIFGETVAAAGDGVGNRSLGDEYVKVLAIGFSHVKPSETRLARMANRSHRCSDATVRLSL